MPSCDVLLNAAATDGPGTASSDRSTTALPPTRCSLVSTHVLTSGQPRVLRMAGEGVSAETSVPWGGPGSVSWSEWSKAAAFGIFHSMAERTSNRVTTRQQMWRVSLLAVDAIQVAVLALRVDYGWSARWFGWLQNMSLLGWLMPYAEPEWYNIVYGVVVLMVWVALADAA